MITFGQLLQMAKQFNADDQTAYGDTIFEEAVSDAYTEVWNNRQWPFHLATGADEGAFRTYPSFTTGTVNATQDSANVTFSSSATGAGDWAPSSWTYPAVIEMGGGRGNYLVTAISGSTGTLDTLYAATSNTTATFQMAFPTYDLPADFGEMDNVERNTWFYSLEPISYSDWLKYRSTGVWGGVISKYAVKPGDGINSGQLYFFPYPTESETVRYSYWRSMTYGRIYQDGAASITKGAAALTGSATVWDQTESSLVGQIVEFPDNATRWSNGTVAAVNSATGITLSANWAAQTQASKSYRISTRLRMPDYMLPSLRYAVRRHVCLHRAIMPRPTGFSSFTRQRYAAPLRWPLLMRLRSRCRTRTPRPSGSSLCL